MATYLEIVNAVLRRIREPTVAAVTDNTYSQLIGELVNDAKREVEDSWQWTMLVDNFTITTVAGTSTYNWSTQTCAISAAAPRERARLFKDPMDGTPLVFHSANDQESFVQVVSQSNDLIARTQNDNDSIRNKPDKMILAVNTGAASGQSGYRSLLVPTPDAVYSIRTYIVNPQDDLTTGSTELLIPAPPVIMRAYLYALYERGEELGEFLTLTSAKADAALTDAIAVDQGASNDTLRWHVDYMPDAV